MKLRCIKQIPHLVEVGDEGEVIEHEHSQVVVGVSSWLFHEPYYTYRTIKELLFKFNKSFFENDIFKKIGYYNIQDYFVKA